MKEFSNLLASGLIGSVRTRNRSVMPPMVRNYATPEGYITDHLLAHYDNGAKGGVGLIIVEASFIDPAGKGFHQQVGIHSDDCVPGLNRLAEAIKSRGAKAAIQLHHAGRQTSSEITGMPVMAPSAVPCPLTGGLPVELSTGQVSEMVEAFARAAMRAKTAGFDAVEIHAAHGYIISQFLSPNTNRRTDKYGGDLDGRMTFLLEVIDRIREVVGGDLAIIVRINAEDFVECGLDLEASKKVAQRIQSRGIDAFSISAGIYECLLNPGVISPFGIEPMYVSRGHLLEYASEVKKQVSLPVISVSSLTPELAEEAIGQGKLDFAGFGRGLLADPDMINKLYEGNRDRVRPCIRCNEFCIGRLFEGLEIRCTVNAEVGFEHNGLKAPLRRKKITVIGGGPGGMEAARVCALRGHEVTLLEKEDALGGHLREATIPDFKRDLLDYRDWLEKELIVLGVEVQLGKLATTELLRQISPDALVIASGSIFANPAIPGIEDYNVATASEILLGLKEAGERCVVAGGGATGCEVALYLADRGKDVTIVEMIDDVGTDLPAINRGAIMAQLGEKNVRIVTGSKIVEVTERGAKVIGPGKDISEIPGDQVILAMGLVPVGAGVEDFAGETYFIGDCVQPRRVGEATREGYLVGSTI
ncbi:MAG: FAD-dependent oxidoreductase [Dehalococcoidia bacterium]